MTGSESFASSQPMLSEENAQSRRIACAAMEALSAMSGGDEPELV